MRYIRQAQNVGANRNFNLVAELARGRPCSSGQGTMTCASRRTSSAAWACWPSTRDPVLAHSRTTLIDHAGRPLERSGAWFRTEDGALYRPPEGPFDERELDSRDTPDRYTEIVLETGVWCFEIFGVIERVRAT